MKLCDIVQDVLDMLGSVTSVASHESFQLVENSILIKLLQSV